VELFKQDLATLFRLPGEGKIKPIIAAGFPLPEASKGYALLKSGQVIGNVVLVSSELA